VGYFGELIGIGDRFAVIIGVDCEILYWYFGGVFGFRFEDVTVGHHGFE